MRKVVIDNEKVYSVSVFIKDGLPALSVVFKNASEAARVSLALEFALRVMAVEQGDTSYNVVPRVEDKTLQLGGEILADAVVILVEKGVIPQSYQERVLDALGETEARVLQQMEEGLKEKEKVKIQPQFPANKPVQTGAFSVANVKKPKKVSETINQTRIQTLASAAAGAILNVLERDHQLRESFNREPQQLSLVLSNIRMLLQRSEIGRLPLRETKSSEGSTSMSRSRSTAAVP